MKIVNKKIDDLIPYKNNPRKNEKAVSAVANSIKEFGFKVPCVIDKNGVIVAGHTRVKAAKQIGMDEVPCVVADDLTEDQLKAFRIADNSVSDLAEWDDGKLQSEMDSIKEFDFSLFGIEKKDGTVQRAEEVELLKYDKVHYLISVDINKNDLIIDAIENLKSIEGVEVDSTLN